ncbi:MAG TPA: pyruvate formate-lyase [Clostridiales bacterium]|jgi:pyruvate formate-lyase/glycerol dehydratase family glycyl radical enzyme|nr:pyruvate formate-lyase [Clostridiales bacterium]
MLNERLHRMKTRYFDTRPNITAEHLELATEAYQLYAGEAAPIFRAKVMSYIMEHMTVCIFPDELIVGSPTNTYKGANLFMEYTSTGWLRDELDEFPTRTTDPYDITPEDKEKILKLFEYWEGKAVEDLAPSILPPEIEDARQKDLISVGCRNGVSGETTPNYSRLLSLGLSGHIARCRELIEEERAKGGHVSRQPKIDFWTGCIIMAEGIIRYAERCAEKAEEMAAAESDASRKAELLVIAENCRHVPANPPRSFHEALQFVWLIQVSFHIEAPTTACGFGRFDQYMYPYLQLDRERGLLTDDADVLELLECFYLKCCEVYEVRDKWYSKSFAGYPMWEILMVGGVDRHGGDATNPLSYLCLDAGAALQTTQPVLALRVHDGTPPELLRKGAEMVQKGMANPGFFSDKAAMRMVQGKGCTIEEARDWCIVGCIQPAPGGGTTDGSPDAGYVNAPKMLELALHNGIDPLTGELVGLQTGELSEFTSVEDIMDAVKKQSVHFYEMIRDGYNLIVPIHAERLPVMMASMAIDGCIESGKSVQQGGAKYSTAGMFVTGPANLGDSLEAIDQVVFKDGTLTLEELVAILDKNFEGEERIRQLLINKPAKFGNDIPKVDGLVRDYLTYIAETVQEYDDSRGGKYSFCNLSQTVNISHGEMTGATPDGRKAYEPFSDNSSPVMGRDISGPTATVKSVGAINQTAFHDGALFNLRFDPRGIQGEKGLEIVEGVIKTYFDNGGEHIQINVVDNETLIDAQKNPEKHRGLMVRVAGYMAYFTELDKAAQDTIIDRTAHLA